MDEKPSLVFFGNEVLATGVTTSAPIFKALIKAGYDIKAVVMSQGKVTSRSYREPVITKLAHEKNIPLISESSKVPHADAAVLVAYGRILPSVVIGSFPSGIINIHPSLLPKYRGPTPIEQTILDDVSETGVSLIKLEAKMDAGPIYTHAQVALSGSESKQELADRLDALAAQLLLDNLAKILNGKLAPKSQSEDNSTYTRRLSKDDGLVDWSKPAKQLECEVRAYAGWPKSRANIHKHDVILTKVKAVKNGIDSSFTHATGDGWLQILELIAPSGRKMSGTDFIRGYLKS